jgi:hypothetical protein
MEVSDDILRKETDTEKQEELEMLQEFERRRKFKTAYDTYEKLEQNDPTITADKALLKKKAKKVETSDQIEEVLKPNEDLGEIYDSK